MKRFYFCDNRYKYGSYTLCRISDTVKDGYSWIDFLYSRTHKLQLLFSNRHTYIKYINDDISRKSVAVLFSMVLL